MSMVLNIFEHIAREHREMEAMLQKLSDGFDRSTFDKLDISLQAHMMAEERTLYLAIKSGAEDMVERAQEDHDIMRELLEDLESGVEYSETISELVEIIRDHVRDEEEDMFPTAREMLDPGRIEELSQRFNEIDERIVQRSW